MIEPSLKINDEYKPLSQLSQGETETLLNTLYQKFDKVRSLPSGNMARQLQMYITQCEERLQNYDMGVLKDAPKETGKRKMSILDDDF